MARTPQRSPAPPDVETVCRRLALPALLTYAFIPMATFFPGLDSSREHFDLTSWWAVGAYGLAETAGPVGASVVSLLMLVLLATRAQNSGTRRRIEIGVVASLVAVLAGGGAVVNEQVVKPRFEVPRPNIVYLCGIDGSGPLGVPVSEFYALGDKEARRRSLRAVLEADPPAVRLHRLIREHWIVETGYSFPSGHAFSAMFLATFFLATGLTWLSRTRLLFSYLLLPWAVCVSYSRPLLWVHTPTDICVGGLEGLLLGVLGYVLMRASLAAVMRRVAA